MLSFIRIDGPDNLHSFGGSYNTIPEGRLGFDLGEIRGSTDFFFILNNSGGAIVTEVLLTTSQSSFEVYPSIVDTLLPNPDFRIDRTKMVRVRAIHGTQLTGTGFRPLMPAGPNTTALRITALTPGPGGEDHLILLALAAELRVYALVMSVMFTDGTRVIDLSKPGGTVITGGEPGSPHYFWHIQDTLRAHNTGNTPVALLDDGENRRDTLQLNGVYTFNFAHGGYTAVLDGMGVVSDDSIYPKWLDGKTYFSFFRFVLTGNARQDQDAGEVTDQGTFLRIERRNFQNLSTESI